MGLIRTFFVLYLATAITVMTSAQENTAMIPATAIDLEMAGFSRSISKRFEGMTRKDISEVLKQRFSCLAESNLKCVNDIQRFLDNATPRRLVLIDQRVYVECVEIGSNNGIEERAIRLFFPVLEDDRQQDKFFEYSHKATRLLLKAFAGVRDNIRSKDGLLFSGEFCLAPEKADQINGFITTRSMWEDSYVAFEAINGDTLTVNASGDAGWLVLELDEFRSAGHISDVLANLIPALSVDQHFSYWAMKKVASGANN